MYPGHGTNVRSRVFNFGHFPASAEILVFSFQRAEFLLLFRYDGSKDYFPDQRQPVSISGLRRVGVFFTGE